MIIGIISKRYARALYSYAVDEGQEDAVYSELSCMAQQFLLFPELRRYLTSPIMTRERKVELLTIAAGGSDICAVTKRFIDFVIGREKQEFFQYMCVAYQNEYRRAKNIVATKFTTAAEVDKATLSKIRTLIETTYKANVELDARVDKNLIGGFVLDVNNDRLDASISGELQRIRKALQSS